jgi:hypothetical protein
MATKAIGATNLVPIAVRFLIMEVRKRPIIESCDAWLLIGRQGVKKQSIAERMWKVGKKGCGRRRMWKGCEDVKDVDTHLSEDVGGCGHPPFSHLSPPFSEGVWRDEEEMRRGDEDTQDVVRYSHWDSS